MSKRYKVYTWLGEDYEFEVVEKSRDTVVLKSTRTGRLYRVKVEYPGDKRVVCDVNGVKHTAYISIGEGVFIDYEKVPVSRVTSYSVAVSRVEEKKPARKPVEAPGIITAPITGRVVEVKVPVGASVKEGDVLLLMESMKMVIEVKSPYSGVVEEIYVEKNKPVNKGEPLLKVKLRG
ncbi:MAG: biotin/lipoyl-binding protein [Desulfurococcaceae archaeon]|nr:biotin/lipoyl-binding protein [Desulfurococcaceae archaeon]MCC6052867.1 biotin/lipoyl-binding protein [Desulfurococcaceae archaeon]